MSRRVPLSRASVVIAELRRQNPGPEWDQLPHDACSDDAAIDAAMREAVDSYHEGEGRWTTYRGPSGVEYRQIAGTMQYQLPDTDKAICAQLRREL